MLVSVILFFIIFGVLVTTHELGHFLIAKANGIRVLEFFIGMGPILFKKQKGETLYSIRLLPIGGACRFEGEDDIDGEDHSYDERSFPNANVWARIAVLFGGPFFNFITAMILAIIVVANAPWDFPVVSGLTEENSAAAEAGLQEGDLIVSVDGEKIYLASEVSVISQFSQGGVMKIDFERDGELMHTELTPHYDEEQGRYFMGVYIGKYERITGLKIIPYAFHDVLFYFKSTYRSLALLIQGRLSMRDVSGPVGMVKIVDDTYEAVSPYGISSVVLTMLELMILLSVNLGVMNLLPFPALDGGRLVFQFIEVVRGKPVPREKEGMVHLVGMVVLMAFMLVVVISDISKFMN
ncbi:RIP metalloprotease RseP [Butyrivibrio sp. FC2001]|jgi:regulator of sigma E protease|uniref:RIP metalloprotease RseP n=1 Tax=Butyrivibrio sp. FC2001 TaxID=1280671 RepID=UPI00042A7034|nr:RIP metalloprotease RseP [Butyrivibrio sp. FC2001]MCR5342982.1 RIP metalloprotease RseP [Butyrivibrio sp.]